MGADDSGVWITWSEAAELVGCPVPTIDWHTRTRRIEHRPHWGNRPSLKRSSVEQFAVWWRDRQDRRQARRVILAAAARLRAKARELGVKTRSVPPLDGGDWITTKDAAAILEVSQMTVNRLAALGRVRAVKLEGRRWVDESDVRAVHRERRRWVSFVDAAAIVGCHPATIENAVRAGKLMTRGAENKRLPSVDRADVERFAEKWAAEKAAAAERRARTLGQPPECGDVWFDTTTTALVIGLSQSRVRQLAAEAQLPYTEHDGKRWFRRLHVEQVGAARVRGQGRS